jgi:hypothetical protein
MNILLDSFTFNIHNVYFLEKKKNTVINGNFTKLVYSTNYFTMNGLYFTLPFLCKTKKQSYKTIKQLGCEAIVPQETASESIRKEVHQNNAIENTPTKHKRSYAKNTNITSSISPKNLINSYSSGKGECVNEKSYVTPLLHNNYYDKSTVHFYPHDIINLQYITSLSEIETAILSLYKNINDITKTSKLTLTTQLYSGYFKIYKENNTTNNNNYFLKISGIWENTDEIGITYKIIETV